MDLAVELAAPTARIVSVGTHVAEPWPLPIARAFRDELSVSFAIGDAIRARRRLVRLVAAGAIDPTAVIDARGGLDDAPDLYRKLAAQQCLKAVVSVPR